MRLQITSISPIKWDDQVFPFLKEKNKSFVQIDQMCYAILGYENKIHLITDKKPMEIMNGHRCAISINILASEKTQKIYENLCEKHQKSKGNCIVTEVTTQYRIFEILYEFLPLIYQIRILKRWNLPYPIISHCDFITHIIMRMKLKLYAIINHCTWILFGRFLDAYAAIKRWLSFIYIVETQNRTKRFYSSFFVSSLSWGNGLH